jgi:uncharacterized protein (DUF885 family)
MLKIALVVLFGVLTVGCGSRPADDLPRLSEEFVYTTLSFSPSAATSVGLHEYQKQNLDDLLDDVGTAAREKQRRFYAAFRDRLAALRTDQLTVEDQADLTILKDQTELALLDLTEIHSHLHNPAHYVETLGNALFSPYVLEFADKPKRLQSIIRRLEKVPLFLDQASVNLVSAPRIWTEVAIDENQGNIDLVNNTIRAEVPPDMREAYSQAAKPALDAMQKFREFLQKSLMARDDADWRLGKDFYERKFEYALATGSDAAATLASAESELARVRASMLDLALPLHRRMFPKHRDHADLTGDERQNQVIGEVLSKIADRHSTRESYLDDARKDLEEARAFVAEKHLLTLPGRSNLQVIPTPVFMRGIYAVGGFNSAPALEPQLGAFYWITPIPPEWPAARAESKLREYNYYKLKLLTIHEAMPGHYVQMEVANDVQPRTRRILRSVYGSGPYIEGWGQFATQTMLDAGFLNHSPEMALTFAKEELRVIANAILDVRLHMLGMTDQEALDLMQKQTFQEEEEARAKLQRAKLSSCQLPTYFVGWREWRRIRDEYRQKKGAAFTPAAFNDSALREGAVPLTTLARLLN